MPQYIPQLQSHLWIFTSVVTVWEFHSVSGENLFVRVEHLFTSFLLKQRIYLKYPEKLAKNEWYALFWKHCFWNKFPFIDVTRMKREKEFHAIKLHSLESHGQSFFQIIIQIYFLFLLLILGTGTVIAGVSAEKFFQDICKLYNIIKRVL